jgi:hypothetical protein
MSYLMVSFVVPGTYCSCSFNLSMSFDSQLIKSMIYIYFFLLKIIKYLYIIKNIVYVSLVLYLVCIPVNYVLVGWLVLVIISIISMVIAFI